MDRQYEHIFTGDSDHHGFLSHHSDQRFDSLDQEGVEGRNRKDTRIPGHQGIRMVAMEPLLIGVDVGGTNIRMGVVTPDGHIPKKIEYPMDMSRGGLAMMEGLVSRLQDFIQQETGRDRSEIRIGIGIAGSIDMKRGLLVTSPNLPDLHGFPLQAYLQERISYPIIIENDANAFTLGEGWKGAAKGSRHYCGITLGTGVGGGIVVEGEILHGSEGMGGEVGHMVLNPKGPLCGCGGRGCLEVYASGSGIRRRALEANKKGKGKKILKKGRGDIKKVTSEEVFEAAKEGDRTALKIFNEMGRYLGLGLVNLIHLFNPEKIVIGGKVSKAWDYFIGSTTEVVHQRTMKGQREKVQIVQTECGDDAGILGAAYVALKLE
ncbi:MAG: ROK family protein [Deltaproteobacteria bacterium]|nr:ROK family protein [Deltaproteobacteria bacterium]